MPNKYSIPTMTWISWPIQPHPTMTKVSWPIQPWNGFHDPPNHDMDFMTHPTHNHMDFMTHLTPLPEHFWAQISPFSWGPSPSLCNICCLVEKEWCRCGGFNSLLCTEHITCTVPVVDPGFPIGGHGLLRQLHFKNFVCKNERIWTLRGGMCQASANVDLPMSTMLGRGWSRMLCLVMLHVI